MTALIQTDKIKYNKAIKFSSDSSIQVQIDLRFPQLPIFRVISVGVGLGFPECESRMFPGFRSRCTIPFEFNAFIAHAVHTHKHTHKHTQTHRHASSSSSSSGVNTIRNFIPHKEGTKPEARGPKGWAESGDRVLGEGQQAPSPPARRSGEAL